jgi:hypothetical protein
MAAFLSPPFFRCTYAFGLEDDSVISIISVIGILALFCFAIGAFVMTLTIVFVCDPFDRLQDLEKD